MFYAAIFVLKSELENVLPDEVVVLLSFHPISILQSEEWAL